MKKLLLMVSLLSLFSCFLMSSCSKKDNAEKIYTENENTEVNSVYDKNDPKTLLIVATEWEPYTSEKMSKKGFLTELSVETLKRAGYNPIVKFFPWARAVEMTKIGDADALIGASYTEERTQYFEYPEILWMNNIVLFTKLDKAKTAKFETVEKLAPAKIGIMRGSFLKDTFTANGITIEESTDIETNIKKLSADRITYFAETSVSVNYTLNTTMIDYKDKIGIVNPPILKDKVYIVFSKKSEKALSAIVPFNENLKAIKNDGTYGKIVVSYGLQYSE